MRYARVPIVFLFVVSAVIAPATRLRAQVTTATLFGIVRDTTGAVLPGANVTMTHEGTGLVRDAVTDSSTPPSWI